MAAFPSPISVTVIATLAQAGVANKTTTKARIIFFIIQPLPLPSPFSPLAAYCTETQAQVSIGEDQFYSNTSYRQLQAENAKKQVFFMILQFVYANLTTL